MKLTVTGRLIDLRGRPRYGRISTDRLVDLLINPPTRLRLGLQTAVRTRACDGIRAGDSGPEHSADAAQSFAVLVVRTSVGEASGAVNGLLRRKTSRDDSGCRSAGSPDVECSQLRGLGTSGRCGDRRQGVGAASGHLSRATAVTAGGGDSERGRDARDCFGSGTSWRGGVHRTPGDDLECALCVPSSFGPSTRVIGTDSALALIQRGVRAIVR